MSDDDADRSDDGTERPSPGIVIVLDANDPEVLARFWAEALGYDLREAVGQFHVLTPPKRDGAPYMLLQQVDDAKLSKNRMHLDLHVPDAEATAERLVELGATRIGDGQLDEIRWITMQDPEGNEFDLAWD